MTMSSLRRKATPLALVAIAVTATAYAYLVDRGTMSDAERDAHAHEVFPTFRVDGVRRVDLTHGGETTTLERGPEPGSMWEMSAPRREAADPSAVDSLLRDMEIGRRLRTVTEGTDLGAVRVRGRVTIGGSVHVFSLAGDAPASGGGAYMTLDAERPFVVERSLKVQLLRTADAYRIRALVPYRRSEIARVEIAGHGKAVVLQRAGDGFRLGAAGGLRASRDALDRIFGALADARADAFLADADADRAIGEGSARVTVIPGDSTKPTIELTLGPPCAAPPGHVVVARAGPLRTSACVAKDALAALEKPPTPLEDTAPLYAHADEVEEIDLRSTSPGGPSFDLARKGTGWYERSPESRELAPAEVDAVTATLAAMAGARATSVEPASNAVHLSVHARATFVRAGGHGSESLEIAQADASGAVLARRDDDRAILHLPRAVARRFEPRPSIVRSRELWSPEFDAAEVVAVDNTCAPDFERLEFAGGRWQMRLPEGEPVDSTHAMDVVDALTGAKVDQWVADRDDGSFGLDPPACRVTLTLTDPRADAGVSTRTLVFGGTTDGGIYGRTLDGPAIFSAPVSLWTCVRRPSIDRSGFRIDRGEGTRVTLSRDHAREVYDSQSGAFVRRDPVDAGSDAVARELVVLDARDALHAGRAPASEGFEHPVLEIDVEARRDGGGAAVRKIFIGALAPDADDGYFARVAGVDATFVVDRRPVDAIMGGW
jgi:hypothetical protein